MKKLFFLYFLFSLSSCVGLTLKTGSEAHLKLNNLIIEKGIEINTKNGIKYLKEGAYKFNLSTGIARLKNPKITLLDLQKNELISLNLPLDIDEQIKSKRSILFYGRDYSQDFNLELSRKEVDLGVTRDTYSSSCSYYGYCLGTSTDANGNLVTEYSYRMCNGTQAITADLRTIKTEINMRIISLDNKTELGNFTAVEGLSKNTVKNISSTSCN